MLNQAANFRFGIPMSAVLIGICISSSVIPEAPTKDKSEADAQDLIALLGDNSFKRRQEAYHRLAAKGVDVLPQILPLVGKENDEIAERCFQLVRQFLSDKDDSTRTRAESIVVDLLPKLDFDLRQRIESRLAAYQMTLAGKLIKLGATVVLDGPFVVEIDCGGCPIKDEHLTVLSRFPKLQELSVAMTDVGDAGIANLQGLKHLSVLNLYRCKVGDEGLKVIGGLKSLKHMAAGETRITDAGLVHLAKKTDMTYLGLRGNNVTDAGVAHLRGLTKLTGIYLGETKITDAALEHLSDMKQMGYIRIHETAITDRGLEVISKFERLKTLLIYDTKATTKGLAELARRRPNLRIVTD